MFKDLRELTVQKSKCHYIFHPTQQGIRQHTVYPVLYLKNLLHAVTARAVYVFTCLSTSAAKVQQALLPPFLSIPPSVPFSFVLLSTFSNQRM